MGASHQESWDVYLCQVEGERTSISLDMGWGPEGPNRRLQRRVIVSIACHDQSRWGLPAAEELDRLVAFEDKVIAKLCALKGVVHVGAVQSGRCREVVLFATASASIDESLLKAIPKDRRAEPFLAITDDPEWRYYFEFMFPPPPIHRRMMDDRVLRNLAESGDDHSIPRRVDHWIYFDNIKHRPTFVKWCQANGFEIEGMLEIDKERSKAGVQIHHSSAVEPDVIHEVIAGLVSAAEEHDGEYDGWETFVMQPKK